METVQIALTNPTYRQALRDLLLSNGGYKVSVVELPDLDRRCFVVTDCEHLRQLPNPIPNPERVVLIAPNEPGLIARAWDAGVRWVVPDKEPPGTAMLAVLSANLPRPKAMANIRRS